MYFYKTGDTILNFPVIRDNNIHKISLLTKDKAKRIEFEFYDGKILKGTYKESGVK